MLALPPDWMCAGAESVVPVFHGALHPLRDGCLRLQICPFCGSGSIPLFFDNERPGLLMQPGALVFAGNLRGRDRDRMEKPPPLFQAAAVLMFASRPLRGATQQCDQHGHDTAISIHAPLAGRDGYAQAELRGRQHFNPRAPCGARLAALCRRYGLNPISIHAPLAGRDVCSPARRNVSTHFNPRAPCGARQWSYSPPGYAA